MILLCGLLVICHAVGSGCVFRDQFLSGVRFMLVCPRGPFWALCCSVYIYMNNLPSVVHGSQLNMYCDDMELHCSSGDLLSAQCGLQSDMDSVDLVADQPVKS